MSFSGDDAFSLEPRSVPGAKGTVIYAETVRKKGHLQSLCIGNISHVCCTGTFEGQFITSREKSVSKTEYPLLFNSFISNYFIIPNNCKNSLGQSAKYLYHQNVKFLQWLARFKRPCPHHFPESPFIFLSLQKILIGKLIAGQGYLSKYKSSFIKI